MASYEELGIDSVSALEEAIPAASWPGRAGCAKTEENLLHGIEVMNKAAQRVRLDVAMDPAEEIVAAPSPAPAASG